MAEYQIDNSPSPINFQEDDRLLRTLQNAKNLLMCQSGEVPFDRCRGFDATMYDLPIEEFRKWLLPELDRIMLVEPEAEVVDATASLRDDGSIYIVVRILVRDGT